MSGRSFKTCRFRVERCSAGSAPKLSGTPVLGVQLRYDNLTGDVLISSGIIAYLGCFLAKYRNESVDSWISLMRENKVPSSSSFLLRSVIGEDVATSRQIEGLKHIQKHKGRERHAV